MAVVIRLARLGAKRKPHHKIVVTEKTRPRDGRFIEEIGYYDPSKKPALVKIDQERVAFWLSEGALPTPTVESILKNQKIPLKVKKGGK
ncbi:MAG: 30S ribosomal protein S16 [Candidatus Omnitrophica bacterium]|nr:30S ribosomal protein S16 [Candidatus Omnitrophota bacterium]